MLKKKKALACMLVVVSVFSSYGLNAATSFAQTNSPINTITQDLSTMEITESEEEDTQRDAADHSDTSDFKLPALIDICLASQKIGKSGVQEITLSFDTDVLNIENVALRYYIDNQDEIEILEMQSMEGNVISFTQEFADDSEAGTYHLIGITYEYNGEIYNLEFDEEVTFEVVELPETETPETEILETETPLIDSTSLQIRATSADVLKIQQFITNLYVNILGRQPDSPGLANWVKYLTTDGKSAANAVNGFLNSKEFLERKYSDSDYVEILYKSILGRASDSSGKDHWVDRLSVGMSRTYVASGFIGSNEFKAACESYGITAGSIAITEARDKSYTNTKFVSYLYTKALGRTYDAAGLNSWTYKLNNKIATEEVVAEGFFFSNEFVGKKYSNSDYVKILYRALFYREYDASGYTGWVAKLSAGMTRKAVLQSFVNSTEFCYVIGRYTEKVNGRIMESQYWTDPQVDDRTLLAAIIYTEARGETYAGQLGTSLVVMNRMAHSNFPSNIRENIYWKNQFQPARTGVLTAVLRDTSVITSSCWNAADAAIAMKSTKKTIPDITLPNNKTEFDYLYFMTPASYEIYKWEGDDIFTLGGHVFFSRIGYRSIIIGY